MKYLHFILMAVILILAISNINTDNDHKEICERWKKLAASSYSNGWSKGYITNWELVKDRRLDDVFEVMKQDSTEFYNSFLKDL